MTGIKFTRTFKILIISMTGFGHDIPWKDSTETPTGHYMPFKEALETVTSNNLLKSLLPTWALNLRSKWRHVSNAFIDLPVRFVYRRI